MRLRSRRTAAVVAASSGGLAVVVGLLARINIIQADIDAPWMEEIVEHRSTGWEIPARAFDFLGGGWFGILVVPIVIAGLFLVARRPWAAVTFLLTLAVSAGIVQLLKVLFARARPEDILLPLDNGSFPSGHVANAATVAALLALLLGRWWVAAAGAVYVVLMAFSRTYLGAHWVTDTIGGALLGAALALAAWAILEPRLSAERLRSLV